MLPSTILADYELHGELHAPQTGPLTLILEGTRPGRPVTGAGTGTGMRLIPAPEASISEVSDILRELRHFRLIDTTPVHLCGGARAVEFALAHPHLVGSLSITTPEVQFTSTRPDVRALPVFLRGLRSGRRPMELVDELRPRLLGELAGFEVTRAQCRRLRMPVRVHGTGLVALTLRRWLGIV